MEIDEIKKAVRDAIFAHAGDIEDIGDQILRNPELGFKEEKTAQLVKQVFSSLSLSYTDQLAITGVKARAPGRKHLQTAAVIGELDAVICHGHPFADKTTGASHSCGHNAQIAAMLGAAFGLIKSGAMGELDGDAVFFAVPAEEFVELEYRERLKSAGKIHYFSGKQELIRLGAFDGIDTAMMVHSQANTPERKVFINGGSTGFIGKIARFTGKAAHAGGAPYEGVNALNAAMIALNAVNAQRETFRDEDMIRFHPIITKGGDLVNVVPDDVRIESYVRGKTIRALLDANKKVNRCLQAGAYATGATVDITELPGYLPLHQNASLGKLFEKNIAPFLRAEDILHDIDMIGSSDIGDLGAIMPVIQPTMGGFKGSAHGADFEICDREAAYLLPAIAIATTVVDLLYDNATASTAISGNFKPEFSKQDYLSVWDTVLKNKPGNGSHLCE